jgi:hypothetical protein
MFDKYTPFYKIDKGFKFSFEAKTCKIITEFDEIVLPTNVKINANQNDDKSINFALINNSFEIESRIIFDIVYTSTDRIYCATVPEKTNINDSYDFLKFKTSAPLLFNMITREFKDFSKTEPYVCSVFTIDSIVKRVTFRFENPVKIIQFD